MHLLLPFDIVPVETQVPQSAFGVTPASERAVRYAFDVFGGQGDLQVTAASYRRRRSASKRIWAWPKSGP